MNSTRVLQDRKFVPSVALDMAKNQLGAKSVWIPVIQKAVDVCNEHSKCPLNTCSIASYKLIIIQDH